VLAAVRPDLDRVDWTLETGAAYGAALESASPARPVVPDRGDDDRYTIYTGGTTGLPKGVVWRHGDAFFACLGGGDPMRVQGEVSSPAELPERISDGPGISFLPLAPMMHAAAQWTSFMQLFSGGKVVLMTGSLDPARVWRTVAEEGVHLLTVVGDAVAKPLLDAWDWMSESERPDVSTLFSISNGGAPMSTGCKARILDRFPNVMVNDGFGSSEAGIQGSSRVTAADVPTGGAVRFSTAGAKPTLVLGDDDEPVAPGSGVVGRIVTGGRLPIGYHGDPEKTAATFLEHAGARWLITGDLATVAEDGTVELLGRGSTSINTGGEKVHPEEVEAVLLRHDDVFDVAVVGTPHERWGQQVTALVQLREGAEVDQDDLRGFARTLISSYKVPKEIFFVPEVPRTAVSKVDYRASAELAASLAG
jgi:acyl-CoA synthetase (AMP-forming)/AMP-acid ligase II